MKRGGLCSIGPVYILFNTLLLSNNFIPKSKNGLCGKIAKEGFEMALTSEQDLQICYFQTLIKERPIRKIIEPKIMTFHVESALLCYKGQCLIVLHQEDSNLGVDDVLLALWMHGDKSLSYSMFLVKTTRNWKKLSMLHSRLSISTDEKRLTEGNQ